MYCGLCKGYAVMLRGASFRNFEDLSWGVRILGHHGLGDPRLREPAEGLGFRVRDASCLSWCL